MFVLSAEKINRERNILLTELSLTTNIRPVIEWGYSSAGRALAWHARGQRFDPVYLHQFLNLKLATSALGSSKQKGFTSPSSSGLGHRPFTAVTGVRVP